MPWYDFECPKCNKILKDEPLSLEEIQKGKIVQCPNCGSPMNKLLGGMKEKHSSWAEWKLSALGNVE